MANDRQPATDPAHICDGDPLLRCEQLVVGHRGGAILPAIDFTLHCGELCAVVGRNGAGKTTWFRTLLGLLPPISGRVAHCVRPLPMSYIPQQTSLEPILPLLARDVVAMGLERGASYLRPRLGKGKLAQVRRCLEQVDALDLIACRYGELSEGQKQRVRVARLLAGQPRLAVLDEPTAAMDMVAEQQTLDLIEQLCRAHSMAVLIVSHQLPAVSRIADQMLFLDRASQTVVQGTPREVARHPELRLRYTTAEMPLREELGDAR